MIDEIYLIKENGFGEKEVIDFKSVWEDSNIPFNIYKDNEEKTILEIKTDVLEELGFEIKKI